MLPVNFFPNYEPHPHRGHREQISTTENTEKYKKRNIICVNLVIICGLPSISVSPDAAYFCRGRPVAGFFYWLALGTML